MILPKPKHIENLEGEVIIKGNKNKLMHIKKHPKTSNDKNTVIFLSTSTFSIILFANLSLHDLGSLFCSSCCEEEIFTSLTSFLGNSFLFFVAKFFILLTNFLYWFLTRFKGLVFVWESELGDEPLFVKGVGSILFISICLLLKSLSKEPFLIII